MPPRGTFMDESTQNIVSTTAIINIINKYFRLLDEKRFEEGMISLIFAEDASIERPNGTLMIGPKSIANSHGQSFIRFQSTQHLTSNFDIELQQKSATFRFNLVAMHVWAEDFGDATVPANDNFFLAGGVMTGEMELTELGWRIRKLLNTNVWRHGIGFQNLAQTDK